MSIIGVPRHNEVIDVILYVPPPPRPKSPMFVSEREKVLKKRKIPKTHQTFGFAEVSLRSAECYLRKGQGVPVPIKKPYPDENDVLQPKVAVAVKNTKKLNKTPKKPPKTNKHIVVDSPRGHKTHVLKNDGINHKDFGVLPKYLVKQKEEIHKAEMEYRETLARMPPLCKPISAEERQELLDGLIHNKTEAKKAFLLLPILTDTIPKVLYKASLERRVDQLEKDVELVERNPYIYIYE